MAQSFHGRTLGAMATTGNEKIRKGFEPMPEGFIQVPFNNLEAVKRATGPKTAAVLIEAMQGEGGIRSATPEFVGGLREWCDQNKLLFFCDCVQCGVGRTGKFCSFQHYGVEMDGVSLAKGLGGGFPIGAAWIRKPYADVLQQGSHATTFGGNPLGARAACTVLDAIEQENLIDNAARMGKYLAGKLEGLRQQFPKLLREVRGRGLMIGIELSEESKPWVGKLAAAGLLTVPTGTHVIRLLPPLIVQEQEADEGIAILRKTFSA
jgi:acetylornithine/succinyldiaminopimelate/putrescine aminotransferase